MGIKQYGDSVTLAPNTLSFFGDPAPTYVPLADVAFGNPLDYVILPHALPPQSMVFPNLAWGMMQWPSAHVIFDEKRNGVAF